MPQRYYALAQHKVYIVKHEWRHYTSAVNYCWWDMWPKFYCYREISRHPCARNRPALQDPGTKSTKTRSVRNALFTWLLRKPHCRLDGASRSKKLSNQLNSNFFLHQSCRNTSQNIPLYIYWWLEDRVEWIVSSRVPPTPGHCPTRLTANEYVTYSFLTASFFSLWNTAVDFGQTTTHFDEEIQAIKTPLINLQHEKC